MRTRWWLLLAGFAAGLACATPRALLVGVSEYPGLEASAQLAGPRHDVLAWRAWLRETGVPDRSMRVLADGVEGAALPTRAAILDALDALAAEAKAGDQVVVFFAGHGSRQPGPGGGLTEVFLPRNVVRWRPGARERAVPNAITADELRERIDRIGERGAFVWAIFDACHAARLVRGEADADARPRQLPPEALGVLPGSPGPMVVPRPAPPTGAVYFYASQSDEQAQEMTLPRGQRGAVTRGVFSYALLEALAGGTGMTYRQLSQAVLLRYGSLGIGVSTTPLAAGTALDAPVMGRSAAPVRQWLVQRDARGLWLGAGALADLQPGAMLALLGSATATDAQALGFARVVSADATSARFEPAAWRGRPEPGAAALQRAAVARLVQPAPGEPPTVAADLAGCARPCAWTGALAVARARPAAIAWTSGASSEIRLVADGHRLWLLPAGSGSPCAGAARREDCMVAQARLHPSLTAAPGATDERLADALIQTLDQAARALELLRNAARFAARPEIGVGADITLVRARGVERWQPGSVAAMAHGDQVQVQVRNTSPVAADVTVLLVDGRYGIQTLYPPAGALNRLEPGAVLPMEFDLTADVTGGLERLVIIATRAEALAEPLDFSSLAQVPLPGHRVVRGNGPSQRTSIRVVSWRLP